MQTFMQRLSEEQLALLPTEEDVDFYEEHGWYISKKVIPDKIIDEAILGSESYYRGERDVQLAINSGFKDWRPEDGNVLRNNEFTSLQSLQLRKLALQPIIGAISARLARTKRIRLLNDQLINKPPSPDLSQTEIGWHADKAYWSTCSSDKLLTAWIPLQDCDESCGPLVVWDGSHKWSWSELQDTRFFNIKNHEDFEQRFLQQGQKIFKVPMTLKKGQMSFHHCWAVHGSYPNNSKLFRLAMAVHLQDDANHYRTFWNKGQQVHICDDFLCQKLPNGDPDYSDPTVFPVLWSEEDS